MTLPRPPDAPSFSSIPPPVPTLLRDLVHERTGTFFENDRLGIMLEKLQPRLAATASASFLDYYYLLKYDEGGAAEWRRVMDAFSVQETYFWREIDQIKALVECVAPEWFRSNTAPLRIWSAACATGEEPYSIAIALTEAGWGRYPFEIIASDGSDAALAKARAAVYRERSFRTLPPELRAKYFSSSDAGYALRPDIASRVTFLWANLVDPGTYAGLGEMHVIFCRNVFIYFSTEAIARTVSAFARKVPPGGYLFIGASESLVRVTNLFELRELGGAFGYWRGEGALGR